METGIKKEQNYMIDPSLVNWESLEKIFGVKKDRLNEKELEKILNYKKTDLRPIYPQVKIGDQSLAPQLGRLSLRKIENNGAISFEPRVNFYHPSVNLSQSYMGYQFTEEDKEQLLTHGNLGKQVELKSYTGETYKAYVSIDPQTNELLHMKADWLKLEQYNPKGIELSFEQKALLQEGKAIDAKITLKTNEEAKIRLQVNAFERGIKITFPSEEFKLNLVHSEQVKFDMYRNNQVRDIPDKLTDFHDYELSYKQKKALKDGYQLKIETKDNNGESVKSWIRINPNDLDAKSKSKGIEVSDKSFQDTPRLFEKSKAQTTQEKEKNQQLEEPLKGAKLEATSEQKKQRKTEKEKQKKGRSL